MNPHFLLLALFASSPALWTQTFEADFVMAALERSTHAIRYDGTYRSIPYPGGDVPADTGVCTDVIIRAYRAMGTDLQKLVHEDMSRNFDRYSSQKFGA